MSGIFRTNLLPLSAALLLGACASQPGPTTAYDDVAGSAVARLAPASGSKVQGTLTLRPMGDGVHVTGEVAGLPANTAHGFHIHEHGDCSAADASSAGGHFNPTLTAHGRAHVNEHHMGDNDNLQADAAGVAKVDAHFSGVKLGGGAANDILDKAFIVHADPDDYKTQPTGNAGKRIACGVIKAR